MDIIGKFIELVGKIYTFPLNWNEEASFDGPDWIFTAFVGALIYGITAIVLICILVSLYHKIEWYRLRRPCQHDECGHQWTMNVSDDESDPNCMVGQPCCEECQERHEEEAIQRRAESEPRFDCPHGHGKMQKLIVNGDVILDNCKQCGGFWIEGNELKRIEDDSFHQGYREGYDQREAENAAMTTVIVASAASSSINAGSC